MQVLFLTLYLFLAHFLADFIFQPMSLVNWKYRSLKGLFIHVIIHWLCYFLILLLILTPLAAVITASFIGLTHLFIDQTKIIQENKNLKHYDAFWIDQVAHWLLILAAILLLSRTAILAAPFLVIPHFNIFPQLFYNPTLLFYLILVIFVTKTLEISRFQKLRDSSKKAKLKFDNKRIVKNLFYLTLLFLVILTLFSFVR